MLLWHVINEAEIPGKKIYSIDEHVCENGEEVKRPNLDEAQRLENCQPSAMRINILK